MKVIAENEFVKVIDFEPVERNVMYVGYDTKVYPIGTCIPSIIRIFHDRIEGEFVEFVEYVYRSRKGRRLNDAVFSSPKIVKKTITFEDWFKVNGLIGFVNEAPMTLKNLHTVVNTLKGLTDKE